MVRHHQLVAETAARYGIAIDAHEPVMNRAGIVGGPIR
jgi:hypothetical protein